MRTAILVLVLGGLGCSGSVPGSAQPYCDERGDVQCPFGDGGRAPVMCGAEVSLLARCVDGEVPACDDDGTPFTCPVE